LAASGLNMLKELTGKEKEIRKLLEECNMWNS